MWQYSQVPGVRKQIYFEGDVLFCLPQILLNTLGSPGRQISLDAHGYCWARCWRCPIGCMGQVDSGDRAEISMFLMIMEPTSRGSGHSAQVCRTHWEHGGQSCVTEHCGPRLGDRRGGSWSLIGLRLILFLLQFPHHTSSQQDYSAY